MDNRCSMVEKEIIFHDGFAAGWFFAVGEWFQTALDIKLIHKKIGKQKILTRKIGKNFSFSVGDTIWDHKMGHTALTWKEALPYINIGFTIIAATPSGLIRGENEKFNLGSVTARVFRIKPDRSGVEKNGYIDCTQIQFVRILHDGIFYQTIKPRGAME